MTVFFQVWMITGDKQETAINIAISCKLIRNPDSLLICNASTKDEAHARLRELQQQLSKSYAPVGGAKAGPPPDKGKRLDRHTCLSPGSLRNAMLGTAMGSKEEAMSCGLTLSWLPGHWVSPKAHKTRTGEPT